MPFYLGGSPGGFHIKGKGTLDSGVGLFFGRVSFVWVGRVWLVRSTVVTSLAARGGQAHNWADISATSAAAIK